MSDALPADYGVNAHGPRARAGMTREQREVHARLASLPKRVHEQKHRAREDVAREASEKAARTRKLGGTNKTGARPMVANTTTGVSHRQMVFYALRSGPKTVAELRAITGSQRVASRVSELRDAGHRIDSTTVGRVTTYTLRGAA